MFELNNTLIKNRKKELESKKEKFPFQTMMKWLDPRQLPLKLDEFIKKDKPNIILDLKTTMGENGDPSLIYKPLTEKGISVFSVSSLEEWENGYPDFISYLKRGRYAIENPIIRRDILFDNYQIVDSKLILADGITLFPDLLKDKELEELYNDAINLDYYLFPVVTTKKQLKKLEKYKFNYIAVSNELIEDNVIKPELFENIIVFNIKTPENAKKLYDKGIKIFWLDWNTFDSNREEWFDFIKIDE